MNRPRRFLLLLIMFMLTIPIVYGTPAEIPLREPYRIKVTGRSVPEGYRVYGTVEISSFFGGNQREVIVEVTLLNSTGGVIDTVTSMVRPTILAQGEIGPFVAKSTTSEAVTDIEYRIINSVETENVNFKYLELSTIWTVDTGVTGWLENIHPEYYVNEAEIIATFLDAEGNPVDVQSYVMNYGDNFNPGEKKKWFCETDQEFDSYILNTQCHLASRERYQFLNVERPNKVNNTWTPPIGETIELYLRDQPHHSKDYVDVTITDPLGNSSVVRFDRSRMDEYRYVITPDIPGVWNITWVVEPFWVVGGVWAEGAQLDAGFFTWDPNPIDENATEVVTPTNSTSLNTTTPSITPPVTNSTKSPVDSASEVIDSAKSTAEEIVDSLPEEVKNQIPGFPMGSILVALALLMVVPRVKAHQI